MGISDAHLISRSFTATYNWDVTAMKENRHDVMFFF